MIKTKYGTYDGDSWEQHCQILLKTKYEEEGYQELPAHFKGDLGIEGYTRNGIVFQCYCPDEEYEPKKMYDMQRDKVTKDLGKLKKFKTPLQSFLGDTLIKKWIFLTPIISNKDIVKHCRDKAQEYREMDDMRDLLDESFDVLVQDEEFYVEEMLMVKLMTYSKIELNVEAPEEEDIINWKGCRSEGVQNLNRKIDLLFYGEQDSSLKARKVNKFVDKQVKNYIKGQRVLEAMQERFGNMYEKQVRIKKAVEDRLEEDVIITDLAPKDLMRETEEKYRKALESENFQKVFEYGAYEDLCKEAIAGWLINCPLDFEV